LAKSPPEEKVPVKALEELASELGCEPPSGALERLSQYVALILRWNRRKRIVGTKDAAEIVGVHLADAMALAGRLQKLESQGQRLLDVGSGAGLPGMALSLLIPTVQTSLCEISEKRVSFLHHARRALGAPCEILHEDVHRLGELDFDHAVSRAVFEPPQWLEVGRRCVRPRGRVWCMLTMRQHEAFQMGGEVFPYSVAGDRKRILLCLQGPSFT
jgi:16S rRNA (guanine527-N7)-methyltransferase